MERRKRGGDRAQLLLRFLALVSVYGETIASALEHCVYASAHISSNKTAACPKPVRCT